MSFPKIEVHRRADRAPAASDDPHVVAVATDEPLETPLPQLDLDDAESVARFLIQFLGLNRARLVR